MINVIFPRTSWPENFPDVIIHKELRVRDLHPNFPFAKQGSAGAALALARDLLGADSVERIRNLLDGRKPFLVPVAAFEIGGFNAIPDAMSQELADRLGLTALSSVIVQANKVVHTKSDGWHRLVTPPGFIGDIKKGATYFLVDDHVGFGGTFANLRGHIESNGGYVLGMTSLTETRDARQIALRSHTQSVLQSNHGEELETFWKKLFGYGYDCLTNIEAGYLSRVESFNAIRNRMAQAAERASRRGLSAVEIKPAPR